MTSILKWVAACWLTQVGMGAAQAQFLPERQSIGIEATAEAKVFTATYDYYHQATYGLVGDEQTRTVSSGMSDLSTLDRTVSANAVHENKAFASVEGSSHAVVGQDLITLSTDTRINFSGLSTPPYFTQDQKATHSMDVDFSVDHPTEVSMAWVGTQVGGQGTYGGFPWMDWRLTLNGPSGIVYQGGGPIMGYDVNGAAWPQTALLMPGQYSLKASVTPTYLMTPSVPGTDEVRFTTFLQVSAVPEASSMTMMSVGLLAMGGVIAGRRRRVL